MGQGELTKWSERREIKELLLKCGHTYDYTSLLDEYSSSNKLLALVQPMIHFCALLVIELTD